LHAQQVEQQMAALGEALFAQVFCRAGSAPDPSNLYHQAVEAGLDRCQLPIVSDDASFLNIPWELLYAPGDYGGYLGQKLSGLFRRHTSAIAKSAAIEATPAVGGPALLVVARPYLADVLARGGSFDLIHFDGHGVFASDIERTSGNGPVLDGHLVFENAEGTADLVSSRRLGQVLAHYRVPVVVLNACQSAMAGTADPYGSVAM
jgi:hypothetical protein